ncbi:O-antigen ligase family protein [Pseudomonas sp. LTJR-52]|nr:O-antigen ligase family protein [Pseudomonas sp. LTJR-52]
MRSLSIPIGRLKLLCRRHVALLQVFFLFSALLPLAVVLLGGYGWPGGSSSWSGSVRAALGLFLLMALLYGKWRGIHLNRSVLFLTSLLFAWVALSSLAIAENPDSLRRVIVLVVFILSVSLASQQGERYLCLILKCSVLLAVVAALLSLFNFYAICGLDIRYRASPLTKSGLAGFADFGNSIISGMHFAFSAVVAFWISLNASRKREVSFWLLCFSVISAYVVLTYSRSAWLALGISCLVLVLCSKRRFFLFSLGILSAVVGMVFLALYHPDVFLIEQSRGITYRDVIWQGVLKQMQGYWLVGHGAGESILPIAIPSGQVVSNTHGLHLEVLFQYGLIGLVLWILLTFCSIGLLSQNIHRSPLAALGLCLLISSTGVMFFELHGFIHTPNLVWQWVWFPLALASSRSICRKGLPGLRGIPGRSNCS